MKSAAFCGALLGASLLLGGCDNGHLPGQPLHPEREEPANISNFDVLYAQNCRGCHGDAANPASSLPLGDPLFLSLIPRDTMIDVVSNGVHGSGMPAFSPSKGGNITDKQIQIIVDGIYAMAKGVKITGLPPYSAPLGNASAGAAVFATYCASCHGTDPKARGPKAGTVLDPAYLGLVSDQYLRTITIVGRSDLGCPNFQSRVPGKAMTEGEIADVVAWMASQRKNEFGQPLPASQP